MENLGLPRDVGKLLDHQPAWDENARVTIQNLKTIFGGAAVDIQHVGSTAVRHIKAKPILDIAVGVRSFDALSEAFQRLNTSGIYKSAKHAVPNDILYVIGDYASDTRTHHIHIVGFGSPEWCNYINLRDYLNACPERAAAYEKLKMELAERYPDDRVAYTEGKAEFITACFAEASAFAEKLT